MVYLSISLFWYAVPWIPSFKTDGLSVLDQSRDRRKILTSQSMILGYDSQSMIHIRKNLHKSPRLRQIQELHEKLVNLLENIAEQQSRAGTEAQGFGGQSSRRPSHIPLSGSLLWLLLYGLQVRDSLGVLQVLKVSPQVMICGKKKTIIRY